MATRKAAPRKAAPKNEVVITLDSLAEMVASLDLDVVEWETFEAQGWLDAIAGIVDADGNPTGAPPLRIFPGLVWVKLRREVDPTLSWEDARKVIRVPLH
jgi:hypothetical protein